MVAVPGFASQRRQTRVCAKEKAAAQPGWLVTAAQRQGHQAQPLTHFPVARMSVDVLTRASVVSTVTDVAIGVPLASG